MMKEFSYKNLILQIIHGSVIILTFIFLVPDALKLDDCFKSYYSLEVLLFLFLAFLIGVIVDLIADILESLVIRCFIKPPIFHLLTKEIWCGITLAHKDFILRELCRIAVKYRVINEDKEKKVMEQSYYLSFKNAEKKALNYILQVAKNKAFRDCKDYQKEQIDSFFILYIFTRNISLSLLISSLAFFIFTSNMFLPIGLLFLVLLTLASSYRYYLYYSRILLGTTIQKEECINNRESTCFNKDV